MKTLWLFGGRQRIQLMTQPVVAPAVPALVKIVNLLKSLTSTEQKVAAYVLERPEEVIYLPVTEVAERVGVSEATVVRFCRKAGFSGFQHLKIAIARELTPAQSTIRDGLSWTDDLATICDKVYQTIVHALAQSRAAIDQKELAKAVEAVVAARRVDVYGVGTSGMVAQIACYRLLRIGKQAVAHSDPHLQCIAGTLLGPEDVAIAISHSGSTRDVLDSLEVAKKSGARTICITNYAKSPITRFADIQLLTATQETPFESGRTASIIAQLALIDALVAGVVAKRQEHAITYIRRTGESVTSKKI